MAENPCYKLGFSHCLAPDAFITESIFISLTLSFLWWKMGSRTGKQHSTLLPNSIIPLRRLEFQERGWGRRCGQALCQVDWKKLKMLTQAIRLSLKTAWTLRGGDEAGVFPKFCLSTAPTFRCTAILPFLGLRGLELKSYLRHFLSFQRSAWDRRGIAKVSVPTPWLPGLPWAWEGSLEHLPGAAGITSNPPEGFMAGSKQSWVPLKLKGSILFPYESAGHAGPTWGTGWDERVFLVIQAGRSLESPRLARCLSRSGTCRTAKHGRTGSSAWTLAHLVRVCEPEPQFLHVWNADVRAVEKTLRKAVYAHCRSPENAWGALCLSLHALSLPSPVRAEGNLSPAWESPAPFPSPWPPLIPFLRTEEAALPTWSPGPQC